MIALIPARAASKRIPGKNTKWLAGYPLICYTIAAAKASGVFASIAVCSDDPVALAIAEAAAISSLRRDPSPDDEPDVFWVRACLPKQADSFAILRPTSPFRLAATIQRAYAQFKRSEVHSIRAVERATQHPGKMWNLLSNGCMMPVLDRTREDGTPWHSAPTQSLPMFYRQNASLEMAWGFVLDGGTISGTKIAPFLTHGYEGFDLNEPADWDAAEAIAASHPEALPRVGGAAVPAPAPA